MIRKYVLTFILMVIPLAVIQADENCTSSCHENIKNIKNLHFPAGDDCRRCHKKTGKHQFTLEDQVKVCFDCHDENRNKKYIHGAIDSSQCVSCHNPHGGENPSYLKTPRIDSICLECHEDISLNKKNIHEPIKSGDCTGCHEPHSANHSQLLLENKEKLCFRCHEDKNFLKKNIKIHSILEQGCNDCHNPHSSNHQSLLTHSINNLCEQCHEDIAEKNHSAKVKHGILNKEKNCLNCHDPHAAVNPNNLVEKEPDLCLNCHTTPLTYVRGKIAYNINRVMKKNPHKHQPLISGKCSQCHDPHGSNFYRLLINQYPTELYTEFHTDSYQLCFSCHNLSLATEKFTSTETNFRDKTRNLHYIHVNLKKGRTCRFCHEVHASTEKKLIRQSTPFENWNLPINFEETPNGGSCSPGCHKSFSYNREIKNFKNNHNIGK